MRTQNKGNYLKGMRGLGEGATERASEGVVGRLAATATKHDPLCGSNRISTLGFNGGVAKATEMYGPESFCV